MKIKHNKDGKWAWGEKGMLALALKISDAALSHILSGRYRCSPDIAARVEQVTEGQITRMDMLYRGETKNPLLPKIKKR